MRKSKFSESQIVALLKDTGVPVADLLQIRREEDHLLQVAKQVRSASISDVKRLRELEAVNIQLKRMDADLALENEAIKDVLNRKCNAVWETTVAVRNLLTLRDLRDLCG